LAKHGDIDDLKRRTREHIIADLAVNHIERSVLLAGYTMHRMVNDYGLDEIVRTYSRRGRVERGLIWLQIKATDHPQKLQEQAAVAVRVERRDLIHWLGEQYPAILAIYDASLDQACWLHVQRSFEGGKVFELAKAATVTVHVPLSQIVNREAIGHFRRLKVHVEAAWRKGRTR